MAKVLRESEYHYLRREMKWSLATGLGCVAMAMTVMLLIRFLGLIMGVILLSVGSKEWKRGISFRRGIQGERKVSEKLQYLSDEFYVLNDLALRPKSGNIDHVVLGPTGIFAIETKHRTEAIQAHEPGKDTSPRSPVHAVIEQAKSRAKLLYVHLRKHMGDVFRRGAFVQPLVVFTDDLHHTFPSDDSVKITHVPAVLGEILLHKPRIVFSEIDLAYMAEQLRHTEYV